MTFEVSSRVKLLFDFWDVHGPAGMVLSVLVVCLLTVFFELLKVGRVWLSTSSQLAQPREPFPTPASLRSSYSHSSQCHRESSAVLEGSPSESSLAPIDPPSNTPSINNSWLLHGIQTALHVLQVTLGYMLMLCVMSYNTWIFLGVILGSALGYFIAFPLLGQI
ncbi:protein SLC31A2 isoform 2-T2 [Polymixia lowei]